MSANHNKRPALKNLGFTHIIVRKTAMGVVRPGYIESVFNHEGDADRECEHLCRIYGKAFPGEDFPPFEVEAL